MANWQRQVRRREWDSAAGIPRLTLCGIVFGTIVMQSIIGHTH